MLWFHLWWTLRLEANQNHKRILAFYSRVIFMTLRWLLQDVFPVFLCAICVYESWQKQDEHQVQLPQLLQDFYRLPLMTSVHTSFPRQQYRILKIPDMLLIWRRILKIISGWSFLSFFFCWLALQKRRTHIHLFRRMFRSRLPSTLENLNNNNNNNSKGESTSLSLTLLEI